jgi:serine/threonine protein phosphatase PrpC
MFALNGCIRASGSKCQDRAAWYRSGGRLVVMVADGAGSQVDSGHAAEFAIQAAMKYVGRETHPLEPAQWLELIADIDVPLSLEPSGETTLVVVDMGPERVTGASVGDSKAFIVDGRNFTDLTAGQSQKPLLGSGSAVARAFEAPWKSGRLLVCSDGLHKYAARDKLADVLSQPSACELIELARLPNGKIFDDAAAVVIQRSSSASTLKEGIIQFIQPEP